MLKDAHETLSKLLGEMKPVLLLVGCNPNQVRVAEGDFKLKHYNDGYDWLHRIYLSDAYLSALTVYRSVPSSAWEMYDAMGTEGLWEQEAIKVQGEALLKAWRTKKPRIFGKDRPYPEENYDDDEQVS